MDLEDPAVQAEPAPAAGAPAGEAQHTEGTPGGSQPGGASSEAKPTESAKQADKISHAFARISREKKALAAKAAELRSAEADIVFARELRDLAQKNPAAVLERLGLDLDTVARASLPPDPQDAVAQDVKSVKAELARLQEERQAAQQQAAVDHGVAIVTRETADENKFPLINAYGRQHLVFETLQQLYQQTGEVADVAAVAAAVEEHLEEELVKPALRVAEKRRAGGGGGSPAGGDGSQQNGAKPNPPHPPAISSRLNGEAARAPDPPFDLRRYRADTLEKALRDELS